MSVLFMVRHGQASFGQANYDRLSELGETQMRKLGEYWLREGKRLDAVYTGTLSRQKRSAECVAEVYKQAGLSFPAPQELSGFNEYDSQSLLTGSLPAVLARHPEIAEIVKEFSAGSEGPDLVNNKQAFQRLFSRVMELWVAGKLEVSEMESWSEFTARVQRALERVMAEQGQGRTVAVFSSGGPISAVMQRALGCSDPVALELGWVVANGSVSEFRYRGNKFSLISFNATPHLSAELMSYR